MIDEISLRNQYRLELFCAIRDSLYIPRRSPHARKTPTSDRIFENNFNRYKAIREEARDWIREGSCDATGKTHGFGVVWATLMMLGSIDWSLDEFVEKMEVLWERVDEDPEIGESILRLMGGILAQEDGRRAIRDPQSDFDEWLGR